MAGPGHGVTEAPRYRQWQHALIAPYLGPDVLEIGSGHGHVAARLLGSPALRRLVVSDPDDQCRHHLAARFGEDPRVEVRSVTLPGTVDLPQRVDTVLAINVLEHIEDDVTALRAMIAAVRPGGAVVIWVPAHPRLYGEFDRRVGHVRRYRRDQLRHVAQAAGLAIVDLRYVNLVGALGWWLAVRRGRVAEPRPRLVTAYDRVLVPLSRTVERAVRPPAGQSLLCVGRASS